MPELAPVTSAGWSVRYGKYGCRGDTSAAGVRSSGDSMLVIAAGGAPGVVSLMVRLLCRIRCRRRASRASPAASGRRADAAAPRSTRSSRSGASRRGRGRYRRGSTRGRSTGRGTADRPVRSGCRRAVARRPCASFRNSALMRSVSACAISKRCASVPGPGRVLDAMVGAVVRVELVQRLDQHVVDRHPDRPAPVRVAAVEPRAALAGLVRDRCATRPSAAT